MPNASSTVGTPINITISLRGNPLQGFEEPLTVSQPSTASFLGDPYAYDAESSYIDSAGHTCVVYRRYSGNGLYADDTVTVIDDR